MRAITTIAVDFPAFLFFQCSSDLIGQVAPASAEQEATTRILSEAQASDSDLARNVYSNPLSFLILYRRYYNRILNYLYRRTMNVELAEDLTSQTFLRAFDYLKRRERVLNFRPWIYHIATNLHLSHERSLKRWFRNLTLIIRSLKAEPKTPGHILSEKEETAHLRQSLRSLPEKYRLVLILRYYEELSCKEISESLGISSSAVRSRISRGLAMLKKQLKTTRRIT